MNRHREETPPRLGPSPSRPGHRTALLLTLVAASGLPVPAANGQGARGKAAVKKAAGVGATVVVVGCTVVVGRTVVLGGVVVVWVQPADFRTRLINPISTQPKRS